MSPCQSKLPSDSIKVVPNRSKVRVESSNPVARGNPVRKPSKVKLITPDEAKQLSSGGNRVVVTPLSQSPRPVPSCSTTQSPRPSKSPRTFPAYPTHETPRLVPSCSTSEASRPVSACYTPEAPRPVSACSTPEAPRPVPARPAQSFRRQIVCGLHVLSANTTTVRKRTNPRIPQSRTVEPPPSPRALEIRARIGQAANATQVIEGTVVEVGEGAKDHGSTETSQSIFAETLSELVRCRPALHPTWRGRIVDSAMLPEFDCEFWAKPASNINRKAKSLRLSRAMPTLLKVDLLPAGHILNDIFDRSPRLSDVEMYLFPDEKKEQRFIEEQAHMFEAMATRSAMIKVNINGTDLLIFSSKVLDKISQFIMKKQNKTDNYLWGFFLQNKNLEALVSGISCQTDKDLEGKDVVDMDLEIAYPTPSVALKLIAESDSIPSRTPVKLIKDIGLPPGFEKIWVPPLVKLNIHGTSDHLSEVTGSAGLVLDESGTWMFGYSRCHKSLSEVTAGLLAIYHGLILLWDSGFRRIRLETTSVKIIDALTTNSDMFLKRKSILGVCKDMILKDWDCRIYLVSKEENLCAEWLASRSKEQPPGLVFYEFPPPSLQKLL